MEGLIQESKNLPAGTEASAKLHLISVCVGAVTTVVVAARTLPLVLRSRNSLRGLHTGARHSVLQLQLPMIILLAGRPLVILAEFSHLVFSVLSILVFSLLSDVRKVTLANIYISLQLDSFSLCLTDLVYI